MNENIFDVLYTLAQENGYTKSSDEFITLLQDNPEARKTMYDISLSEGFTKSLDEFEDLVKIDKKNSNSSRRKTGKARRAVGYKLGFNVGKYFWNHQNTMM